MNIVNIQESILNNNLFVEHIINDEKGLYAEVSLNKDNSLSIETKEDKHLIFHQRKYMKDLSLSILNEKKLHINKSEYVLLSSCTISEKVESISYYVKETISDYFLKHNYIMLDKMTFNQKDNVLRISLMPIPF